MKEKLEGGPVNFNQFVCQFSHSDRTICARNGKLMSENLKNDFR